MCTCPHHGAAAGRGRNCAHVASCPVSPAPPPLLRPVPTPRAPACLLGDDRGAHPRQAAGVRAAVRHGCVPAGQRAGRERAGCRLHVQDLHELAAGRVALAARRKRTPGVAARTGGGGGRQRAGRGQALGPNAMRAKCPYAPASLPHLCSSNMQLFASLHTAHRPCCCCSAGGWVGGWVLHAVHAAGRSHAQAYCATSPATRGQLKGAQLSLPRGCWLPPCLEPPMPCLALPYPSLPCHANPLTTLPGGAGLPQHGLHHHHHGPPPLPAAHQRQGQIGRLDACQGEGGSGAQRMLNGA